MERRRMADCYPLALSRAQQLPRRLGQADLVDGEQLVRTLKQDRNQFVAVGAKQNLRPGRQAFGPADGAVGPHDDNGFALSVQVQAADSKARASCALGSLRNDRVHGASPVTDRQRAAATQ